MKKQLSFCLFASLLVLCPFLLSAERLNIGLFYKVGIEKRETQTINDNYWLIPVKAPTISHEQEKYSLVVEGYSTEKPLQEKIELTGAAFSRHSILLPLNSSLFIENREDFAREVLIVEKSSNKEIASLTIEPHTSQFQTFSADGEYLVIDKSFSWNTATVKILKLPYLFLIRPGSNKIDIPDIAAGSCNIAIYYGTELIFREGFTVVPNAQMILEYQIENGKATTIDARTNI
ncbi:hypothetical protein J5834_01475 [bacterium]|nr:hypothetical protein [bacterium]